jgi:hypothetical protein
VLPTLQHSATLTHVTSNLDKLMLMHTMSQAPSRSDSGTNNQQAATVVDIMSQHPRDMLTSERPGGLPPLPDPTKTKLMPSTARHAGFATTLSHYEEDIDDNPHSHFLSPVHMYESWDDSDDDSDDGSFEFDAGITDFALFNDDYKRAKELNLPLSDKWNDFVEGQADALDRAVARTRAERGDHASGPFSPGWSFSQPEVVPSLTPDTSPRLADDLDYDSAEDAATPTQSYHTKIVTPESTRSPSSPIDIPARSRQTLGTVSESAIEDDDFEDPAAPAFLLYRHSQRTDKRRQPARPQPAPVRPGLSAGSRTLSGKLHVWRRPSWDLFSVDEEREEEAMHDESGGRTMDGTLRKKRGKATLRE